MTKQNVRYGRQKAIWKTATHISKVIQFYTTDSCINKKKKAVSLSKAVFFT